MLTKKIVHPSIRIFYYGDIGWNDLVKPFKEDAMFWHSIWISAGKPLNNTLHHIMKRTRNIYHYHVRKCRRSADVVKGNKLLDACVNGNGEIFEELNRKLWMVLRM